MFSVLSFVQCPVAQPVCGGMYLVSCESCLMWLSRECAARLIAAGEDCGTMFPWVDYSEQLYGAFVCKAVLKGFRTCLKRQHKLHRSCSCGWLKWAYTCTWCVTSCLFSVMPLFLTVCKCCSLTLAETVYVVVVVLAYKAVCRPSVVFYFGTFGCAMPVLHCFVTCHCQEEQSCEHHKWSSLSKQPCVSKLGHSWLRCFIAESALLIAH